MKVRKKKNRIIAIMMTLVIFIQVMIPILSTEVFATEEITENAEITRNYEIKEEEVWDISANQDGSIMAKWTRSNRTIVISGMGEMKDWNYNPTGEWHNNQYTSAIEKVMIEEGIMNIGRYAFIGCSSLTSISIPEGVTTIGYYAFSECSALTSITIPKGVTSIDKGVFSGCSSLESIVVDENNQKYISENGILFNKEKTEIITYPAKKEGTIYNIPENVNSIDNYAFYGCSSLESINIPEGVTKIGRKVFYGCNSLESIIIPARVTSIGDYAFYQCSRLESITIPEGVRSIGSYAFYQCSSLKSIKIPEKVTMIEEYIFYECNSLTEINIPEGVTSIGGWAFYGCSSLESINIPEEVTKIGVTAFYGCSGLTSITIPEGVTSIGASSIPKTAIIYVKADTEGHRYAEEEKQGYILEGEATNFSTNYELKEDTWDVSANQDGSIIAKWIMSDRSIVISGQGEMKNWNFDSQEDWHNTKYTFAIEKVIIEGVTSIGEYAFYESSNLKSINIPEGVISIGNNAFDECSSLSSINIPEGVTSIGDGVFRGCSNLESIDIPERITNIGHQAFIGCSNLKRIILPKGITSIGYYAFCNCNSLKSITIPEGVKMVGIDVFSGCSSLEGIIVDENNQNYISENEILFNKEKTEIIAYPSKKEGTIYNIPEGVTSIGSSAFKGCTNLESIIIPEGVTNIRNSAFYGCSNLEDITIPEKVVSIEYEAFFNCSNLEKITIPKGVTSIGWRAFEGCSSLRNINIPSNVTSIMNEAISSTTIVYTKSNTEGHRYAEEGKQGYIIDDEGPEVIFEMNGDSNPSKKQGSKVIITDKGVGLEESTIKYKWTQSVTAPVEEEFINTFSNEETLEKDGGDGEWYLWVLAKDKLGNTSIERSEAFVLDNTPPTIEVSYSTTEPTRQNVTATIKANEAVQGISGWNLSRDRTLTKEYSENTEEEITIKDLAGNETKVNIKINNIDKTLGEIKKGDINQDEKIDTTDLLKMLRHIAASQSEQTAQKHPDWVLTGNNLKAADINDDEKINPTDTLKLLRHMAASKSEETANKHPDWIIQSVI